ncbi:hypothetical protein [Brevibacterium linens]|uniref:Uncharacterized protein n=1 Tax=Brevibacterium linens TaxID=1703 RepID=A0A0B9A5P5_BRELN|nr:hypothetical protein [Brevibacterium linens]KHS50743.1 hypothetical protein AE0388_2815 [Brevibacterium linens]
MTDGEDEFNSISELLSRAHEVDYQSYTGQFVRSSYELVRRYAGGGLSIGRSLAAIFDLTVTALYMENLLRSKWYFCANEKTQRAVYPFVNTCPSCALSGEFAYIEAGKPPSAKIGKATSVILAAILDLQAKYLKGENYRVCTIDDNGLVDACLIGEKSIGLFEIKSAPLVAFPLMVPLHRESEFSDCGPIVNAALSEHVSMKAPDDYDAFMLIDENLSIPVGSPGEFGLGEHYRRILEWLSIEENFRKFVESWTQTFNGYAVPSLRGNTFWLTNGCGVPTPRPESWPQRRPSGGGYASISDGKSSVGMDRTDDVKKGIYQVIKISTHYKEFFPSEGWEVSAALVSNIHAVKHHENYLKELEDVVWTIDGKGQSHVVDRDQTHVLIERPKLHNLFDGIIAFTKSYFRDDFLREIYDFNV